MYEIVFCSECESLIKGSRIGSHLVYRCKCGHIELDKNIETLKRSYQQKDQEELNRIIDDEIREIGEIDNTIEQSTDSIPIPNRSVEDYNFPNKIISRKLVLKYIQSIKSKGLISDFKNQKVLILTHINGFDIKELLSIGYIAENFTIVERDNDTYNSMKNNEFFHKMNIHNIDLVNYKSNIKFDLIYLDFKSNFHYQIINILKSLIMNNSKSGTIFYINVQMARETKDVVNVYSKLSRLISEKDCKLRDTLIEQNNQHLLRQKMIELSIKSILNIPIINNSIPLQYRRKMKSYNSSTSLFPEDVNENERNLRGILRYLTNSLVLLSFFQFIYRNRNNTPFLNSLFLLKSERSVFRYLGFKSLINIILRSFFCIRLKKEGILSEISFKRLMDTFHFIDTFDVNKANKLIGNHAKRDYLLNRIADCNSDKFFRFYYNFFIHLYSDLDSLNILNFNRDLKTFNITIQKPDYQISVFEQFFTEQMYKEFDNNRSMKKGYPDISPNILQFHFIMILFNYLEYGFDKNYEIDRCVLIDCKELDAMQEIIDNTSIDLDFGILESLNKFKKCLCNYIEKMIAFRYFSYDLINKYDKMIGREISSLDSNDILNGEEEFNIFTKSILEIASLKVDEKKLSDILIKIRSIQSSNSIIDSKQGGDNLAENDVDYVKRFCYKFIEENPEMKSADLLIKIKDSFKEIYGFNLDLSEFQIRAYKAWITIKEPSS